jgi:transcriptional regulator with XRE-family HTH domain
MSIEYKIDLLKELIEKEFRDAYAVEQVKTRIPFQIRALRARKQWNQEDLAKRVKTSQTAISRIEDPNYGKLSLQTLFKIASAFDVALLVKFVPFSQFLPEYEDSSPEALCASNFSDDFINIEEWASDNLNTTSTSFRVIRGGGQRSLPWGENAESRKIWLVPDKGTAPNSITSAQCNAEIA